MRQTFPLLLLTLAFGAGRSLASEAFDQGVAEAKADISKNIAFVYTFGLKDRDAACQYDRDSGLRCNSIAGCIVDNGILERQSGYNQTIQAALKNGMKPDNSLQEFHNLAAWWAVSTNTPVLLSAAAQSFPNQKVEVSMRAADGSKLLCVDLKDRQGKTVSTDAIVPHDRPIALLWGPAASQTFVLRYATPEASVYVLLDRQTGERLKTVTVLAKASQKKHA